MCVHVVEGSGRWLVVRAVASDSAAVAAELQGTRREVGAPGRPPDAGGLEVPVLVGGEVVAGVELCGSIDLGAEGRLVAEVAAERIRLVLRAFGARAGTRPVPEAVSALTIAGDALVAGAEMMRTAAGVARLAAEATGALCSSLWVREDDAGVTLAATWGAEAPDGQAQRGAESVLAQGAEPLLEDLAGGPGSGAARLTLPVGRPALGALQLVFAASAAPDRAGIERLASFAGRVAQALRQGERQRVQELELERTRALLAVVGQAIAQLSLAHTLETAIARVAELLETDRVAVYLEEVGDGLVPAAVRGLEGRHAPVAERLLELALGPFRARELLVVEDAAADPRLGGLEGEVAEAAIEGAVAVPLLVGEEAIGLLVVFRPRGRGLDAEEAGLLSALAAELAVAVQNARLHEQAKKLGTELEGALAAERQSSKELGALYEISRSFSQNLSLDATLDAVARTLVELLDVDAAVIRMPDERAEELHARTLCVADPRLADPLRAVLCEPQPLPARPARRRFGKTRPLILDAASARDVGNPYELLTPFLEKGSTAVILPIATPGEVLATLTLVSLDPARPIRGEAVDLALSIADQAALAIDNARLYQQQRDFADTMQRSLLPQADVQVPGLEVGHVYESSAQVDVGGDVYDFMVLAGGRLAVVLGDVTGHGIEAAADMAMAKFVFRSLAREHSEPESFLAYANDVVVDEIALGKFITLLYLTIDPDGGELACASAGHPAPRIVAADGSVAPIPASGLALGIVPGQRYEPVTTTLAPGAAVVLYTDGVIEARRRSGELYGEERLDGLLAARHALPAAELAGAVLEDCRRFSGSELADDCAVVVIRRLAA